MYVTERSRLGKTTYCSSLPRSADRDHPHDRSAPGSAGRAGSALPLAPADPHRPARPRHIDHLSHDPSVNSGNDPATKTSRHRLAGLDLEDQPGQGLRQTATRWRPGKSRSRSHRSQRSSTAGHTQQWLSIVEVLGASRGTSPLIIEDLDVYPKLHRTTGVPTLIPEEPYFRDPR